MEKNDKPDTTQETDQQGIFNRLMVQLDELRSRIRGNPKCTVRDCHGRGFTGYLFVDSGTPNPKVMLQLCVCGKETETEYTRLQKHIDANTLALINHIDEKIDRALLAQTNQLLLALEEHSSTIVAHVDKRFDKLQRRTILYWLERGIQAIWFFIKKQNPVESSGK
jgi:hypothetical protein